MQLADIPELIGQVEHHIPEQADNPIIAGPIIAGPIIAGLTSDSRIVRPGFLFAALPGTITDGRAFVQAAKASGALAILTKTGSSTNWPEIRTIGLPIFETDNPRQVLARLAAHFYPTQPTQLAAVTGTNGKTSVAAFTAQILSHQSIPAACIGTLGVMIATQSDATQSGTRLTKWTDWDTIPTLTTLDPVTLHAVLARLADTGIRAACLEASSHGLDQYRLDGVRLQAAGFTHLSRDHLDYHGDMAQYFAAKLRLFAEILPSDGVIVLNMADPYSRELDALARKRGQKVLHVFGHPESSTFLASSFLDQAFLDNSLRLIKAKQNHTGWELELELFGIMNRVDLPLFGHFQIDNALLAVGLAIGCGMEPDQAIKALATLKPVPGRLELCARLPNDGLIFVDYAHTPDALRVLLGALRSHCRGRLIVVFGAGGDRDRGKRLEMGQVCDRFADQIIVTDDNPRHEDPAAIRAEILAGCPDAQEYSSRSAAISYAINQMRASDILVIAGKGHEQGQIIGDHVLPFDDRLMVKNLL